MDVLWSRSARTVVGLRTLLVVLLTVRGAESGGAAADYLTPGFRPPSVPLIVVDPYLRYVPAYDNCSCQKLQSSQVESYTLHNLHCSIVV